MILVATNQKAIDSLLSSSFKLGGDVSDAIDPLGGGAKGALTVLEARAGLLPDHR